MLNEKKLFCGREVVPFVPAKWMNAVNQNGAAINPPRIEKIANLAKKI